MAINVNEVYKTVLLILNKEQRGYITPDEFNKIGTQVQLEIFEKYFEDMNQQLRVRQDDTEYADRVKNIDDKISIFKTLQDCSWSTSLSAWELPTDPAVHRIGTVFYEKGVDLVEVERVQQNELVYLNLSPITKPSETFPVYAYEDKNTSTVSPKLYIQPATISGSSKVVKASYVRKPSNPRWGYSIGNLGQYIYDANTYIPTGLPVADNYLFDSLTTNFFASGAPTQSVWTGLETDSAGVTYSGLGTDVVFNLTLDPSTGVITNLTVTSAGTGFAAGDTITLDHNVFQAPTPGGTDAIIELTESSLYNGSTYGSTQFEIDNTDQTELILNILKYCGIVIRDPQIIQTASQMAMAEDNNEKQ